MASLRCTRQIPSLAKQLLVRFSLRSFSRSTALLDQEKIPPRVWRVGRLNHVAIAVPNLQKATMLYRDIMGAKVSDPEPQTEHGVYTVFVELGDTKIELLHPLGKDSPISNFLEKNKSGGMHHICIEVDDLDAAVESLLEQNIRTLAPEPKIGAHGKAVIFLHPKDCGGVLVELEQA